MEDIFSNIERLLILQMSEDVESCEINAVTQSAENLQLGYHREPLMSARQLGSLASLCKSSHYDLVYICGHGNDAAIGEQESGGFETTWPQLSTVLCNSLSPNASFFLSCCDGGLDSVATDLFAGCYDLRYVFGVPRTAYAWQLVSAFTNVLTQLRLGATRPEAASAAESALRPQNGHLDEDISDFQFEAIVRNDSISATAIREAKASIVSRYKNGSGPIQIGRDCWNVEGEEICGVVEIDRSGRERLVEPTSGTVLAVLTPV